MTQDPFSRLSAVIAELDSISAGYDLTVEADGLVLDARRALRQLRDQLGSPGCEACGITIHYSATGRPRVYCSDACRQAAHRAR